MKQYPQSFGDDTHSHHHHHHDGGKTRFSKRYVDFLDKIKIPVLIIWLICVGVSAWVAPKFISKTTDAFEPPPHSNASLANAAMSAAFPQTTIQSSIALYIAFNLTNNAVPPTDQIILSEGLNEFTMQLNQTVFEQGVSMFWNQTGIPTVTPSTFVSGFQSYYTMLAEGFPSEIANQSLLSTSQNSTIISITLNAPYTSSASVGFSNWLADQVPILQNKTGTQNLLMVLTGVPAFLDVMQDSAERDLALMDGIVMPIAMLILAYILRTLRLMILPLLSIGSSTACSFALMYVVASYLNVTSVASSLMMSILVAMSIDYSLFLLTRYREELFLGSSPRAAVETMIASAGHTIAVSGMTLATCFLGLIVLPLAMMRSIGIACAIAITITLLVNVTQIPCLLLLFSGFFSRCVVPFNLCGYVITVGSRPESTLSGDLFESEEDNDNYDDIAETNPLLLNSEKSKTASADVEKQNRWEKLMQKRQKLEKLLNDPEMLDSYWYRFGKSVLLRTPFNILIILCVVGFTIYFILYSTKPATTDGLYLDLPRTALVTKAYAQMCNEFGYGKVYPYNLLMTIEKSNFTTVLSQDFFNTAQYITNTLVSKLNWTTSGDVSGISNIPFEFVEGPEGCFNETSTLYNVTEVCEPIRYAISSLVNENATATYAMIQLGWDPLGINGDSWLKSARSVLLELESSTGVTLSLSGVAADSMDAIDAVYNEFPLMIEITCGVVLIFVAFAFRSIFIPLRAAFTIGLTLGWVYGFADLTYEHGIFDWMHFAGLQGVGAVMWLAPVVSFSIIVGIGLDYDIFLLVRTREYRMEGFTTPDSILLGLYKTGRIITAAGIIMAIAFSGLLFSDIPSLNQLAFYLVFAVLFDTFIVRSALVPSLTGLMGEASWWPGKVPKPIVH